MIIHQRLQELQRQLSEAVALFEPRLMRHTLTIKATIDRHMIGFEMHGELWANPVSEKLFVKTKIDLETGQCLLGDGSNG